MASPDLIKYEYGRKPNELVGSMILADATTQIHPASDSTAAVVIGPFDATGLTGAPYGYQTDYPLMLKLYCSSVNPDSTGEFKVTVSGKLGDATCQRESAKDFALTWKIRNWDALTDADATVSIRPYPPVTSVSMNCVCGIATDYVDRDGEGSYA